MNQTSESTATPTSAPVIEAVYPLSPSQQGMLLESLAAPDSGLHVEQSIWDLDGRVDVDSLADAWEHVIQRHPALRTSFVYRNRREPLQAVVPGGRPVVNAHDWRKLPRDEVRHVLNQWLAEDRRRGFNLSRAPLMRFNLMRTAEASWTFIWTSHHILFDGWCAALLSHEVLTFYKAARARRTGHPTTSASTLKPAKPYQDYITWLARQNTQDAERWWRQRLNETPEATWPGRPTRSDQDSARSDDNAGFGHVRRVLAPDQYRQVKELAVERRLTAGTLIMAAWALQLARYADSTDVVFGTTVSGRPPEIPGVESIIGLFTNTVPLRVPVPDDVPLSDWLETLQTQLLERREFEYCSAGQIHQFCELPVNRPLYRSIVVVENYPVSAAMNDDASLAETGFEVRAARHAGAQTHHPVTILATSREELELQFVYDKRHIVEGDAQRLVDHMLALLQRMAAAPDAKLSALADVIPDDEIPPIRAFDTGDDRPRTARTGDHSTRMFAARSSIEMQLLRVWRHLLRVDNIGVRDRFFDVGGTSLLAVRLMANIEQEFQRKLSLAAVFQAPTIESMAALLVQESTGENWSPLVPMQPDGDGPPLFCVHPLGGNVLCYDALVRELDDEQPVYGLQAAGFLDGQQPYRTADEMANAYLREVRRVQPDGDYRLTGYSFGGYIAYEMARRIVEDGGRVGSLTLIDTPARIPEHMRNLDSASLLFSIFATQLELDLNELQSRSTDDQLRLVIDKAHAVDLFPPGFDLEQARRFYAVCEANHRMDWSPGRFDGPITLVRARESETGLDDKQDETAGWCDLVQDVTVVWMPGRHEDILEQPQVKQLAAVLGR